MLVEVEFPEHLNDPVLRQLLYHIDDMMDFYNTNGKVQPFHLLRIAHLARAYETKGTAYVQDVYGGQLEVDDSEVAVGYIA